MKKIQIEKVERWEVTLPGVGLIGYLERTADKKEWHAQPFLGPGNWSVFKTQKEAVTFLKTWKRDGDAE